MAARGPRKNRSRYSKSNGRAPDRQRRERFRPFFPSAQSTRIDPRESLVDRLRFVRPDEPVDFAAVAEENERGPELHPKRPTEPAARPVLDAQVAHVRVARERVIDERRRASADAAPRRAEIEDDRSLQRIDVASGQLARGITGRRVRSHRDKTRCDRGGFDRSRRGDKSSPALDQRQANALAWQLGRRMLERAIGDRLDFAFETTLGGATMTRLLSEAAAAGIDIHVWYVGLADVRLHVARVRARVAKGGHAIGDDVIARRFEHSRLNLIHLPPALASLRVYNSVDADPAEGRAPQPSLVLQMTRRRIVAPDDLSGTPGWAKPIVAAALAADHA